MTKKLPDWRTMIANIKTDNLRIGYYLYEKKKLGRDKKASALWQVMGYIEREKKPYPIANGWEIEDIYITTDNRVITFHIGIDKEI